MSHGFINEPNLFLVLSSQSILLPVYLWHSHDTLTSYIYLFLWLTSTVFHSFPSKVTHTLDRVSIVLAVLHSPILMYRYSPYTLIWCNIPHVYNYIVFMYGYKHKKYFFDSNLQIKTAYHVGMYLLTSLSLVVGSIVSNDYFGDGS